MSGQARTADVIKAEADDAAAAVIGLLSRALRSRTPEKYRAEIAARRQALDGLLAELRAARGGAQ